MTAVDEGTGLGVAGLIMDLQSVGLRLETELETSRQGGAGPSDSGMLWIDGVPVTVPPAKLKPCGKVPWLRPKVTSPVPPDAWSVWL